jgi:tetratricopeptide (TPR) repeat protein
MKLKSSIPSIISLLLVGPVLLPQVLSSAGGASVPSTNPADQAAEAYDQGLGHRDRAWKLEAELESVSDPAKRDKLEAKVQKEYQKAIRAFRSAIEVNPALYQAHSSLGYALRKTGDYEASLASYDQALQIEPNYAEAIEYRAEAYLGLNRIDDAKDAYLQLFRSDQERADELLTAMKRWLAERASDPQGLSGSVIEEFSAWVEERSEIAGHTASLEHPTDRTW